MATIVNLRRARKARARSERAEGAAANAARHGTLKAGRRRIDAEAEKAARDLDGHAIERPTGDDGAE